MDTTRLFVDHASFEEAFHRRETDLGKVPELWVPDEHLLRQVLRHTCPLCHSGLLNLQWFHEPRWTGQNRPFVDASKPAIADERDRGRLSSIADSLQTANLYGLWFAAAFPGT
jgi:hypothetical protein